MTRLHLLIAAWQTAEPMDAAFLVYGAVCGIWLAVAVLRGAWVAWRLRRAEDWTEEGSSPWGVR